MYFEEILSIMAAFYANDVKSLKTTDRGKIFAFIEMRKSLFKQGFNCQFWNTLRVFFATFSVDPFAEIFWCHTVATEAKNSTEIISTATLFFYKNNFIRTSWLKIAKNIGQNKNPSLRITGTM